VLLLDLGPKLVLVHLMLSEMLSITFFLLFLILFAAFFYDFLSVLNLKDDANFLFGLIYNLFLVVFVCAFI
jgi:hypothetical protein